MPGSKVAIIGTGYVGLTTGACLARLGHQVVCADVDAAKVERLQRGVLPIVEDGLEDLVREGIASGRLKFVLGAAAAVADAEFVFMCLPTPQGDDGLADMSYVLAAAGDIRELLAPGAVVINKSTVPVGSAGRVAEVLGRADVAVASNPEFLREGSAVHDFFHPDRVVIGAQAPELAARVAGLYAEVDAPKLLVATSTAELIKYASNAFLAMKISFANSMSNLSEAVGADAHEVLRGVGHDKRIGSKFLEPGPGWGGSCFPKDAYALIGMAEAAGYDFDLLKVAIRANDVQAELMVDKLRRLLGGSFAGMRVAAWGLSFKAGTDDTRQSPALRILARAVAGGATVTAFDPAVKTAPEGIALAGSALAACDGADVLVVLTEWPEFSKVALADVAARLTVKRLFDTRNIIDTDRLSELGFEYASVGHSEVKT